MPISEFTGEDLHPRSEEWRHECEVRWLLDGVPSVQARRNLVNGESINGVLKKKGIRQHRGNAAADKIIEDLRRLHALRIERAKTA